MNILIVDNGTSYLNALRLLCQSLGEVTVSSFGQVPPQTSADLLVLSGGHHYAVQTHPSEFQHELKLIKHFNGPIIAICLGHELLAYAHHATLERLPHKERGLRTVKVTAPDPIFADEDQFSVFESHRWAVKAAPGLTTLAASGDGIEIIRHPTKPLYSFQFHPEQTAGGADGKTLFERAVKQITA